MVQIVLSISKEHNKKLRELAMKEFEGKKGALSAIVEKGIDLADAQVKQNEAHDKLLWLAKNCAKKSKTKWNFNRNEIYADRMQQILNR
ncbi:MAG: hypothetical protein PHY04_01055 [Candidatus ainarchaeum sp.]|nr:hypothetical protein [Candidatus ainarchaeum sp.]MDD3085672.1 hypothetical protein [Candidatus ainarchaeum sp.]MDD4128305.1 hypothetical protein [Candidatus ainarchaeum sp.]MDD4467631.1 hypothetical protein [Candidatus ainarchaeum sp.]